MSRMDRMPFPLAAAEAGASEWRAAVAVQRAAKPDHCQFYELAGELLATLRALESMCEVLGRQVAGYGLGRVLRDDAGAIPAVRLADAADELARTRELLATAERTANGFWSAIGHIGVEGEL